MTAVEWLINEWLYLDQQFDMCLIDRNIYWDKLRQIQEQAKEMDKKALAIIRKFVNEFDEEGEVSWNTRDEAHNFLNNK